jgi:hypothetical protein
MYVRSTHSFSFFFLWVPRNQLIFHFFRAVYTFMWHTFHSFYFLQRILYQNVRHNDTFLLKWKRHHIRQCLNLQATKFSRTLCTWFVAIACLNNAPCLTTCSFEYVQRKLLSSSGKSPSAQRRQTLQYKRRHFFFCPTEVCPTTFYIACILSYCRLIFLVNIAYVTKCIVYKQPNNMCS